MKNIQTIERQLSCEADTSGKVQSSARCSAKLVRNISCIPLIGLNKIMFMKLQRKVTYKVHLAIH